MSPKGTARRSSKHPTQATGWQANMERPGWSLHTAGDFGIALQQTRNGVVLHSLFDLKRQRELLARRPAPLFTLSLRSVTQGAAQGESGATLGKEVTLTADAGWRQVAVTPQRRGFRVEWERPADAQLAGLRVTAQATADARHHAWRWTLAIDAPPGWTVWRVVFPQVALRKFDKNAVVLVPSGPGELKRGAWDEPWTYEQPYGQAWCTMQVMAAYGAVDGNSPDSTGLYFGLHDPLASTKDIIAKSDPAARSVWLAYDQPAPDMGRAGNGFRQSGEAVWQLLRGDWYDVAMTYKAWASANTPWWPKLGAHGRADTPLWMREVSVWLQSWFAPAAAAGASAVLEPDATIIPIKRFREFVGVPVALHSYGWHEIPFDNDYPHYFPTKPGYAEAVRELQQAGVFVMPYINGRLWDTHDRGAEDFEFTSIALPAATKDEHGQPYVERYGSKEVDGSPVTLAAMCPTTGLWQRRVHDLTLRLINEVGVDGVYIDQVAAMKPTLCMDASHGHPLGGGHWWNEGYWRMIDTIRAALPEGRMITTECNAEAFARWFDGYLTWHWQHDGMVPVFPAIYGATVQSFGRAYGGATPLAKHMKLGQQFVFGEQIGWFGPDIINNADTAGFMRQVARLRWQLRRYFYAGEMLRPPRLGGVPIVKADWQWQGECWVTTDAVLTGAWRLPGEKKLVLLFANVSDEPVNATLAFNARDYGVEASAKWLTCAVIHDADTPPETQSVGRRFQREATFEPRRAVAWEFTW